MLPPPLIPRAAQCGNDFFRAPCIAPRLPFTKKIEIPAVPQNLPKSHTEISETFFYNTIPRRPLSFAVHPDWLSEVLLTKRIALEKKLGIQYKHKNFSFLYWRCKNANECSVRQYSVSCESRSNRIMHKWSVERWKQMRLKIKYSHKCKKHVLCVFCVFMLSFLKRSIPYLGKHCRGALVAGS